MNLPLSLAMNRLHFPCHVERSRNISQCSEGLLTDTERIDAPSQINPFAMAARESAESKEGIAAFNEKRPPNWSTS